MKRQARLVVLLTVVVVVLGVGFVIWKISSNTKSDDAVETQTQNKQVLTFEEVKSKFDCGRVTTDHRATDIYCANPELYAEHLALTDQEIKDKFECDRKTRERRQTDAYCQNPQKFRDDIQNSKLIEG